MKIEGGMLHGATVVEIRRWGQSSASPELTHVERTALVEAAMLYVYSDIDETLP